MNGLNFNILYDVEDSLSKIHDIINTKDLTPSLKEDILNVSAIQVSRILELYDDTLTMSADQLDVFLAQDFTDTTMGG